MLSMAGALVCTGALAAALAGCAGSAAVADAPPTPVRLEIANEAEEPIRCIAIIAHFLSTPLGVARQGEALAVTIDRYDDGGLAQSAYRDRPMWIENVRCGLDSRWSETAIDLPLETVRDGTTAPVVIACGTRGRAALLCVSVE